MNSEVENMYKCGKCGETFPELPKGVIRCPACGNEDPIISRLNRLMQVLALSMVNKPYRLLVDRIGTWNSILPNRQKTNQLL